MGCLIRIAGIVAILAGIGVFLFWMSDTDASNEVLVATFCDEQETIVRRNVETSDGTSIEYYCRDQTNNEQDITLQVVLLMIGSAGTLVLGGGIMATRGARIFPQLRPKVTLDQTAAGQKYGLNRVANVTFTQDTYTAQEVERKMVQIRQLLQSGMLTQEQFEEISAELKRRQI